MQAEFSGTLLIDFVIVATLVEWAVLTLAELDVFTGALPDAVGSQRGARVALVHRDAVITCIRFDSFDRSTSTLDSMR
jgi:hypothetical protein